MIKVQVNERMKGYFPAMWRLRHEMGFPEDDSLCREHTGKGRKDPDIPVNTKAIIRSGQPLYAAAAIDGAYQTTSNNVK